MDKLAISFIISGPDFAYIKEALRSLKATTQTPHRIYVVVNNGMAPNDPALLALLDDYPDLGYIINQDRMGFAANHNQVMVAADAEYVALLNDDIILHEGAMDKLVAYMDAHPDVGLTGSQQYNPDGTHQVAVYDDPSLFRMIYKISGFAKLTTEQSLTRRVLQRTGLANILGVESLKLQTQTHEVDIIKGVVMFVRRTTYEQAGMMDETTPIYGEEAEWHLRIRKAGWKVVFVAESKVTHFGQGQATLNLKGRILVEDRRSILNYFIKHRPRWQVWVIRAAIVTSHTFWGVVWFPFSRSRSQTHFQTVNVGLRWQRPTED
ncbi:MAG: glycosyltransferase [Anaerolineales bacterium]|nr:glycosyltransferase [Anaerolineales bacterium]